MGSIQKQKKSHQGLSARIFVLKTCRGNVCSTPDRSTWSS